MKLILNRSDQFPKSDTDAFIPMQASGYYDKNKCLSAEQAGGPTLFIIFRPGVVRISSIMAGRARAFLMLRCTPFDPE